MSRRCWKPSRNSDCQVVNNVAKIELYADDLRKLHAFARALRQHIANRLEQPATP